MTTEEKAKAYDEALKRAKKLYNEAKANDYTSDMEDYETIFPELKESEDEKIRKALINIVAFSPEAVFDKVSVLREDCLTWLEKQGKSSDQIHYWTEEEIEPIINDYLRGVEHYGGMIGRLRCLKPKSLEKQGKVPVTINIDKMVRDYANNKECGNEGFGKPINCMIRAYRQGIMDTLKKQDSSSVKWQKNTPDNKPAINHTVLMKTTIGIVEGEWHGEHWFQYRWSCRLKDSEVLYWMELSDLDKQDEQKPTSDTRYEEKAGGSLSVNGKPFDYEKATITQKDFAPEQELKKIEDEIEIPFGAKDSELIEESYYIPKGFHAEIDDDKVVIKKGEKPVEWSDEDEHRVEDTIYFLDTAKKHYACTIELDACIDWLKSLKNRIGG